MGETDVVEGGTNVEELEAIELELMIVIAWTCKNLPRREHFTSLRSAFVHIVIKYSCNIIEIDEP